MTTATPARRANAEQAAARPQPDAESILRNPILQRGLLSIADKPGSGCVFHRVTMPYLTSDIRPKNPVFVINRLPAFDISLIKNMQRQGVRIVVDMDDDMQLGESHPLYRMYQQHSMTQRIQECVQLADLVTVTNSHLADALRPFAKRIEVIPNALPFDTSIFTRSPNTEAGTPFVFAGGSTHRHDLDLIREATSGGAEITIAGYDARQTEWQLIRKAFPNAQYANGTQLIDFREFLTPDDDWRIMGLTFKSQEHRERFLQDSARQDYMALLNGHRCALAPLVDNAFNRSKSNLKVLEAGAKGIPVITSRVHPYLNDIDKDVVLYADDGTQWRKHMQRIRESRAMATDLGEALAEHVRKHYHLNDANALRKSIIENL